MPKTCAITFIYNKNDKKGKILATVDNGDTFLGRSNFQCPNGTPIYLHSECDKYYTCHPGQQSYFWQCSYDWVFDLVYNGCNYPELTSCGDRSRPINSDSTTPSTTTKAPTDEPTIKPPIFCLDDGF